MSTIFRSSEPQEETPVISEFKENKIGADYDVSDIEPVSDSGETLLSSLGIDDSVSNLDEDSKSNLGDVDSYVKKMIKDKGLSPTKGVYEKTAKNLMAQMGIDPDTEPSIALDKMAGVINGYRSLSFIRNVGERKRILGELLKLKTSKDMDGYIFNEMEKRKVWQ